MFNVLLLLVIFLSSCLAPSIAQSQDLVSVGTHIVLSEQMPRYLSVPQPIPQTVTALSIVLDQSRNRGVATVRLVVKINDELFVSAGQLSTISQRQEFYALRYYPPNILSDLGREVLKTRTTSIPLTRLVETTHAPVAWIELEHVHGEVDVTVITALASPGQRIYLPVYHHSVAFDAAASAEQEFGSGALSWSHTASGTDRAVFLGAVNYREAGNDGIISQTYPGTGATSEMWDVVGPATDPAKLRSAGWYRVAPSTGAQTASFDSDLTDPTYKAGGTISMTGVHQTTPVGTAVTGNGLTSAETLTVSDAASGDLVLDNLISLNSATGAPTIGLNQTQRNAQDVFFDPNHMYFRQSSQDGADGGVMSWTITNVHTSYGWVAGAVAFKPSSAAAAPNNLMLLGVGP